MGGWLCTARPEKCAHCGRSAILLARTQRCDLCEIGAYDAPVMQEDARYVPQGPKLRARAAAREARCTA